MENRRTSLLAIFGIIVGIIAALMLLGAGYGYQWGWWGLGTAFTWLLPGSLILGLLATGLGVTFGFSRRKQPEQKGQGWAWTGTILGLAVIGTIGYWFLQAQQYPPIHDISTDIQNPPTFEAVVPLRADAPNDTTYGDQEKANLQREAYPDIETVYLDTDYPEAFDRALKAAQTMGWEEMVAADKATGRIEATDEVPWFGFKDDIVIRVDTSQASGQTAIDVRSVSRIGRGDIGVNAHRIREYLEVLEGM
ncbi:DUF1499 domain-containing protein [Fodinibius salsisoli]|uniref:DUF1499 domain-containing protein n=1 Tax=Fodinibius salsisoli TaxID=2820877 RepID=A0ABT3PQT7_9BACT|nr:DUF1499 domain-containing protein [Fodinibius salsisoli]MCW9708218.1 DUF1499 domain-containing protein [Fodinibius salsisoli]